MKPAIVQKLDRALGKPIRSEQQVVYILVELRKLLELEGQSTNFPSLVFHSDWVVHTRLSRKPALTVLKAFNKRAGYFYRLEQLRPGESIADHAAAHHSVNSIVSLDNFQLDFTNALQRYNLPLDITQNSRQWCGFVKYYGEIIRDCPLFCEAKNMPYIDEVFVEVSQVRKETTRAFGIRIQVNWKWRNKHSGTEEHLRTFF